MFVNSRQQYSIMMILCFIFYIKGTFTGWRGMNYLAFVCEGTKCYKDERIGDRDGNIYHCDDDEKTECCIEDAQPSCCEKNSDKIMREQLILWGSLASVVVIISIAVCYFWKDISCCKDDTPLNEKCCRRCKKKAPDDEDLTPIPDPGPYYASPAPWSLSTESYRPYSYRASPSPPPFKYRK